MLEVVALAGTVGVGVLFAKWVKTNGINSVPWSDISHSQLEAHQKLAIAMADRVHLDPACRELLRHQVKLLKTVGIVGKDVIDVTPEPNKLQESPSREVGWVKTRNGMRRTDYENAGAEGFGFYQKDSEDGE
jgi:hypothetical protein